MHRQCQIPKHMAGHFNDYIGKLVSWRLAGLLILIDKLLVLSLGHPKYKDQGCFQPELLSLFQNGCHKFFSVNVLKKNCHLSPVRPKVELVSR